MNNISDIPDIVVTDLSGYNIDDNTPFVLINSKNIHKLLNKIAEDDKSTIFDYNKRKINDILKLRNVDPNNFMYLGHVIYQNGKKSPQTIILGNKNICQKSNEYDIIMNYSNGQIVTLKPTTVLINSVPPKETSYSSIGLLFIKNGDNQNLSDYGIIPNDLIIKLNTDTSNVLVKNDFSLLSLSSDVKTIQRSKLYSGNMSPMKLSSISNKYITSLDTKAILKTKHHDNNQSILYNAQGELIVNDKCLTYDNPDKPAYFTACGSDNKNQKWNFAYNTISPQYDQDKCLSLTNDENIYVKGCDQNNDNQSWNIESDNSSPNDFEWNKFKGKTVVLVESNNPWYVNQDTTIPAEYYNKFNVGTISDIKENPDTVSTFVYDTTKKDLGLGYSYADHLGQPCKKVENIEGFADTNTSNNNIIITIIILIIILLLICRYSSQ